MKYVKWTFYTLIVLTVFGFLHYVLPQHDIVRITDTDTRRIDFGENSIFWASPDAGTATTPAQTTRDVKFIETIQTNGRPMVYRNEDTGWIWPPYFKFDSYNLQTEASDLRSTSADPRWVVITHYGWRNEFLTIFPNAVSVRLAEGPDERIIPWANIVILTLLAVAGIMLRRMWMQFRERTLDPVFSNAGDAWEDAGDRAGDARRGARTSWGRFKAWLRSLGG